MFARVRLNVFRTLLLTFAQAAVKPLRFAIPSFKDEEARITIVDGITSRLFPHPLNRLLRIGPIHRHLRPARYPSSQP